MKKNIEEYNDKNISKGYYVKYDGYHDNENIHSTIPTTTINLNKKEHISHNSINSFKKIISSKQNSANKSYNTNNNSDINLYQRKTHQVIINNKKNYIITKNNNSSYNIPNNIGRNNNYNLRTEKHISIGQKLIKKEHSLKGGITTVIQHYGGRKKQLENYDPINYKSLNSISNK